ncbi:hypothetical protein GGR51DRAFT_508181 [Nemania sp. FL0031]|nr:hypothetical protein GGR51DRAFT_508181 [Nemania sp. FL0031]
MTQQPRMDQNLHQPYPLPPGVLNLPMSPPYVTPQGELYGPPSMNQFAPGQPLPITRGHPSIEDTAGASSAGSVSPAVSPFPTPAILQINVQQLKELREPKIGEPSAHSPTATSSDAASQPAPPAPPASLAPPTPDGGLRNSQPRKRRRDSLPSLAAENAPESIDPPFDLAFELYFDTVVKDYEDWKADMIEEERRKARILELRAQ